MAKQATALDVAQGLHSDPYVQAEIKRERVRIAAHSAELKKASGVRWSGMEPTPFKARTIGEILADADAQRAKDEAFFATPRGRFVQAMSELRDIWPVEIERATAAYNRGFADESQEPNAREIGVALKAINELAGNDARAARLALAEILNEIRRAA